jgi:hypothetical protein
MKLCKTGSIFYWHVLPFVVVELLCAARNENSLDTRGVGERSLSHHNECLIKLSSQTHASPNVLMDIEYVIQMN